MVPDEQRGTATAVSQQSAADHEELRSLFSPTETLRVLDDFSKWVFATTAVVGAIGGGLGLSALSNLNASGRQIYLAAVACLSVALVLATLARAPRALEVNRDQPEALRSAFEAVVKRRYALLLTASLLVAAAFALAAAAAVVSA